MSDTTEIPFRTRVLYNQFDAIQEGDTVWVTIMPKFVPQFPTGALFMEGRVIEIRMVPDPVTQDLMRPPRRLVIVKTDLGQWSFTQDGLSLNKIARLSVYVRATGQRLDLYEPVFVEGTPPNDNEKEAD